MSAIDRRRFLAASAATLAARRLAALEPAAASPYELVATVDRTRILRLAKLWLSAEPQTITDFPAANSPGGSHDFFSQADYFWPDPANPKGPYINRDGESNPDNFQLHRRAMLQLSQAVSALTAAFVLTRRAEYARAAAAHLTAWFVTPATRMNPNLQYAQGYPGGPKGRSYGIIDTLHLVEPARAATFLHATLGLNFGGVQRWFREYLAWMTTSDFGIKERDATNNHAIAWALQASEFARLTGEQSIRDDIHKRLETVQLPTQEAANGSFPRELARTKPFGYSIFQFDCATTLGWSLGILSQGEPQAADSAARAALCRAAAFLYPYLADKSKWPYPHDVQHWGAWPVRSPGLLFCGLACDHPDYIALWKRLDPDPTDPEIIRNFPIREPLLWVASPEVQIWMH